MLSHVFPRAYFQQYLNIPVYTIFKNLTIILIVRDMCLELTPAAAYMEC